MSKTILVSGASGIVGYGILRSLQGIGRLIGMTIYDTSPADCFSDIVLHPPLTSDERYIPFLIDAVKKYNADMIIPAIEADMKAWNCHRKELEETGAFVLLNNSELIELCLDKWKFYEKLKSADLQCSIETSIIPDFNRFKLPFLLKPRCGFGSKGIVKIESRETFEKYKDKIGSNLMMQEFIGTDDEEYTAGGFFDRESSLKAFIAMRRKLSKQGFTEAAQVVFSDSLKEKVKKLAAIFKPIGACNFQFRIHDGDWKLLEINPRISSSASIRAKFGYNESRMSVDYFLDNKEIVQPEIKKGSAVRYTEDYIFYENHGSAHI